MVGPGHYKSAQAAASPEMCNFSKFRPHPTEYETAKRKEHASPQDMCIRMRGFEAAALGFVMPHGAGGLHILSMQPQT